MPRPYKPQPLQKPRMNMGMGTGLPTPDSIIDFSAKNPVDPSSMLWHHMSRGNQVKMYKMLANAVNEQMKAIERQGQQKESQIYQSLKEHGYVLKTGSVGFTRSNKEIESWSSSTLKKKYSQVYSAHQAKSYSASQKSLRERMEEQLAHIGIDFDELMKNPDENTELLREFWSLVNEGERVGLWDKFGLGSYEAQEIVKEFMKDRDSMPKAGRGAHQVALGALKKVEKIENDAAQQPNRTLDAVKQEKLVTHYDSDKMKSARDLLLNKLAVHKYGTKPIEKSFENLSDEEKEYLLF